MTKKSPITIRSWTVPSPPEPDSSNVADPQKLWYGTFLTGTDRLLVFYKRQLPRSGAVRDTIYDGVLIALRMHIEQVVGSGASWREDGAGIIYIACGHAAGAGWHGRSGHIRTRTAGAYHGTGETAGWICYLCYYNIGYCGRAGCPRGSQWSRDAAGRYGIWPGIFGNYGAGSRINSEESHYHIACGSVYGIGRLRLRAKADGAQQRR